MSNLDPADRHLKTARQSLRAALDADRTDPDQPGSGPALARWEGLLDITERLEDLMGVEHPE